MTSPHVPYSPRVSACGLIPMCYTNVDSEKQIKINEIFKRLGLNDDSPLVRRALAENMEAYVRVVSKNITKIDLFEIWQSFIADKIDVVRIKALETAALLARFFKKEEVVDKFLKPIKMVDANRKSWRVRYSLAESVASLLPYLDKESLKKDVVEIYEELLKDTEAEVRCIALLKCPEVAAKISPQQSFNVFFPYLEKSASENSLNVKLVAV